jgi:apolipoprotein N-acyltransferase
MTAMKDSFVPGTEYTLFQIPGGVFGTPICWENTFPDLFRRFVRDGAQFMVSVTNEGFFGSTAAPHQTLAMNVFRAVENRVAIARAATTGVSAFISPKGEVLDRIRDGNGKDVFVSGVLVGDLPLAHRKAVYTTYGDVFAHIATGVAVASVLAAGLAPGSAARSARTSARPPSARRSI